MIKKGWADKNKQEQSYRSIKNIKFITSDTENAKIKTWGKGKNSGINIVLPINGSSSSESTITYIAEITGKTDGLYDVDLYESIDDVDAVATGKLIAFQSFWFDTVPNGFKAIVMQKDIKDYQIVEDL